MESFGTGGKGTMTGHKDLITRPQTELFDPRKQDVKKNYGPTPEENRAAREKIIEK